MRRAMIALLALGLVLGTTLVATGRARSETGSSSGDKALIRWDLIRIGGNIILAGGRDVSTDAATSDAITITGSGHAEPGEKEAAGGGTFVHRHKDGTLVAQGAYHVTGFISWQRLTGGSFAGTGLIDGIANGTGATPDEQEETSGVLTLAAEFVPLVKGEPQPGVQGTIIVNCDLPGTSGTAEEGVEVQVPSLDLDFTQTSGNTLLHLLD